MKILFVPVGYLPAYRFGGPIYSVSAIVQRLIKKGHQVIVFTTNSNLSEDLDVPVDQPVNMDGAEIWYFRHKEPIKKYLSFIPYLSKSMGFLYAPLMRKYLDRIVPTVDIVHTQMPFIYPTYAAGRAAIRHNKPLFYNQHGVLGPEHLKFRGVKKRLYISAIELPIMRKATTLIALTQNEIESYRALGLDNICRIIPNGVDLVKSPMPIDVNYLPDNILPDDLVILFMARLHPTKGADRLIKAFLQVYNRFPSAKLVMAGPDEWGMVQRFQQDILDAGAANRVMFPGMVTGRTKQELLSRADLFCLPSSAEGFSIAVLEALANATAVLISPECNFNEVKTVGAGCVAVSSIDKLSRALVSLLEKPEELKNMGRKGQTFVSKKYSWETITDNLIDVYIEGIHRNKSRAGK